jgi:hypothetical protein
MNKLRYSNLLLLGKLITVSLNQFVNERDLGGGVLKSRFDDSGDDVVSFDTPLKKPSKVLFYLGVLSVLAGTCIGIFGIISAETATNSREYLLGLTGYLLTALMPIVFLQVIRHSHTKALHNNHDEPYDIYAGTLNQNRFLKVVLAGLISAALSIWVFFLPIAEIFAS